VESLNQMAARSRESLHYAYLNRTSNFTFDGAKADEYVLRAYYPMLNAAYQKL